MKYPQAYVFLKNITVEDRDAIRRTMGAKVEVHFEPSRHDELSAVDKRATIARKIIHEITYAHVRSDYVVISTQKLGSMFALKYADSIVEIVWIKSNADFVKLRSLLQGFKNYWALFHANQSAVFNYRRLSKIFNEDSPEFMKNDPLFSALDFYNATFDRPDLLTSLRERLQEISRIGKYEI